MHTVKIKLYDSNGEIQSAGLIYTDGKQIKFGEWIMAGEHVLRHPVGLIRRIATAWHRDGADREYMGHDDQTGTAYVVSPAGGNTQRELTLRFRVTESERDQLHASAEAEGVTLSQFIRSRCL